MKKKEIEITKEDIKLILNDDFAFFEEKIVPNCYCSNCKSPYNSTITNYTIYLNDLNDVILKGFCEKCGNPINRYMEIGEVDKYQKAVTKVRRKLSLN